MLRQVKGLVTDSKGEPLIGVTVKWKDGKPAAATDADGFFVADMENATGTLVFSYVGYKNKTLPVRPGQEVKVVMEEDQTQLQDVVVTGFGSKNKNSFTGSQTTIKQDQLLSAGTRNVLQSIAAFVPGMNMPVNNNLGSDPNNATPDIMIRGRATFEGSANMPIFVVDGGIVDVQYIYDMDMNDIESVTVLKDASASALYGAKASAGVIVIQTRSLKGGKLKFSYSGTGRLSVPDLSGYHLLSAQQKLEYERLAGLYTATTNKLEDQYALDALYAERSNLVASGQQTDWISKPLQNSFSQDHSLSMDGGDEFARYAVSVRYGNETGVMRGSGRERLSASFRLTYNKDNKFYFANSTTINAVNSDTSPYGSFSQWIALNPYDSPYESDGTLRRVLSYETPNPLYDATTGSFSTTDQFYILNNTDIRYWLMKELRIDATFSITKGKTDGRTYTSPLTYTESRKIDPTQRGSLVENTVKALTYSGKLMMSYNKYLTKQLYTSVIAGANVDANSSDNVTYTTLGYYSDKLSHPSFAARYSSNPPVGGDGIDRSVGFFINANSIWDEKYFLDLIYRYEGSSKFGKNDRFAPFWSVGAGWNLHKEAFMKQLPMSLLKLRGSVGYLGNISFSPYQALTTYRYLGTLVYDQGIGAVPITPGNPDLTWERTLSTNLGLDLTMFKGRWDLTLDLYYKNTDNLLLDVTKAPSIGVQTAMENVGAIENKGFEVQTRVVPIQNKEWYWGLTFNYSYNKNKIKKISNALKAQNEKNNAAGGVAPLPVYEEGQSLSAIKVVPSAGIDPATGQEVYIKRDGTHTFVYDAHDKITYGDTTPYAYGKIGSYLTWKQWSLNVLMGYSLGGAVYNETLATRVEGANPRYNADERVFTSRWKEPGNVAKFKNIADQTVPLQTSRFVEVENYLEMQTLSLAYEFKAQQIRSLGINRLRIEALTNNLFWISSVKRERGLSYPFTRSVELTVRFSF